MPTVRKGLPDWLQRRTQASGARVTSTPYTPSGGEGIVPTWLTQLTGGAPVQEPLPGRTGTMTATDQPTTRELNEAYWRERQHDQMLATYGIEAEPIQERTRVEIPEWLRGMLPEGFSERMFEAATGAPITFTGGGPVVGGVQLPKLEGGPEYLQTRGGQELPEDPNSAIEQWLADYKAGLIDDGLELQRQKERRGVVSRQLRYLALQEPPETTDVGDYEGGGGSGWWSPGGYGGGYTPKKAASRWWMNLSKWNI